MSIIHIKKVSKDSGLEVGEYALEDVRNALEAEVPSLALLRTIVPALDIQDDTQMALAFDVLALYRNEEPVRLYIEGWLKKLDLDKLSDAVKLRYEAHFNPTAAPVVVEEAPPADEPVVEAPVKRGRGRPPKVKTEVAQEIVVAPVPAVEKKAKLPRATKVVETPAAENVAAPETAPVAVVEGVPVEAYEPPAWDTFSEGVQMEARLVLSQQDFRRYAKMLLAKKDKSDILNAILAHPQRGDGSPFHWQRKAAAEYLGVTVSERAAPTAEEDDGMSMVRPARASEIRGSGPPKFVKDEQKSKLVAAKRENQKLLPVELKSDVANGGTQGVRKRLAAISDLDKLEELHALAVKHEASPTVMDMIDRRILAVRNPPTEKQDTRIEELKGSTKDIRGRISKMKGEDAVAELERWLASENEQADTRSSVVSQIAARIKAIQNVAPKRPALRPGASFRGEPHTIIQHTTKPDKLGNTVSYVVWDFFLPEAECACKKCRKPMTQGQLGPRIHKPTKSRPHGIREHQSYCGRCRSVNSVKGAQKVVKG